MISGDLDIAETVGQRRNIVEPVLDLAREVKSEETRPRKLFSRKVLARQKQSAFAERVDVLDLVQGKTAEMPDCAELAPFIGAAMP